MTAKGKDLGVPLLVLGSGISLGAGLPNVAAVTDAVLARHVYRHSTSTYRLLPQSRADGTVATAPFTAGIGKVAAAYEMIELAAQIARRSYASLVIPITYEDVFEVIREISRGINSYAPDPAIAPVTAEITARWMSMLTVGEGATEALACVRGIFYSMLRTNPHPLVYLDAVLDSCVSSQGCDIFTLNHDLLVEARLDEREIAYADGFGEKVGLDLHFWDDSFERAPVRLYKLHGSIDWYWYNLPDAPDRSDCPARCTGDPAHPRDDAGSRFNDRIWPAFDPVYLTGIGAKFRGYQVEPYADLFGHFQTRLRAANNVVVAGYGFGDSGINDRLLAWIRRDPLRRLVVVDPTPGAQLRERLEHLSRMLRVTRRWLDDGRFVHIAKRIEASSWAEIQAAMAGGSNAS